MCSALLPDGHNKPFLIYSVLRSNSERASVGLTRPQTFPDLPLTGAERGLIVLVASGRVIPATQFAPSARAYLS